ncbi:MAG: type II toxin-antitoxin system VapC family toxin [Thermoanaerobaculia bacterium]
MIFVDSNIPMYLVGAEDSQKAEARGLVERCVGSEERLVTDAEALQEILHRYVAIRRPEAIQPAFDALLGIVDEVFPIEEKDVDRAKTIVLGTNRLSARDAIHLATMESHGVMKILSFDAGFDGFPGVSRVS